MQVTVTGKFTLEPDASVFDILSKTMDVYREACNFVSGFVFLSRDLRHRPLHDALYRQIRSRFSLGAQMSESILRTVLAKYKTLRSSGSPWTLCRFRRPQCDLVFNRDYSIWKNGTLSVNTLSGRIRTPFRTEGFEKHLSRNPSFGTASLVFRHGQFFLQVPMTFETDIPEDDEITNVTGVDRGIRFLAVSYDSTGRTSFFSGAAVKQKRAHYKELSRNLQRIGTSSSRRRIRSLGQRENRWISDVDHCVAKALCAENPRGTLFVLEDLSGIRSAVERVRTKDRYVSVSWPYGDLERKLRYKAALNGQKVILVNPAYTSQACPVCGNVSRENRRKGEHSFQCLGCGYRSNDDRIGAMNLHRMGNEYLVQSRTGTSRT